MPKPPRPRDCEDLDYVHCRWPRCVWTAATWPPRDGRCMTRTPDSGLEPLVPKTSCIQHDDSAVAARPMHSQDTQSHMGAVSSTDVMPVHSLSILERESQISANHSLSMSPRSSRSSAANTPYVSHNRRAAACADKGHATGQTVDNSPCASRNRRAAACADQGHATDQTVNTSSACAEDTF